MSWISFTAERVSAVSPDWDTAKWSASGSMTGSFVRNSLEIWATAGTLAKDSINIWPISAACIAVPQPSSLTWGSLDNSNGDNFKRKSPGRNNHNAPKLIEKYNDLAREALSNGDKILSENYLQHADHFMRILNERESFKRERNLEDKSDVNGKETNELSKNVDISEKNLEDNSNLDPKTETVAEAN